MSHPMENVKFYDGSLEPIKQLKQVIILQSEYEELKQKADKAINLIKEIDSYATQMWRRNLIEGLNIGECIKISGLLEKE